MVNMITMFLKTKYQKIINKFVSIVAYKTFCHLQSQTMQSGMMKNKIMFECIDEYAQWVEHSNLNIIGKIT